MTASTEELPEILKRLERKKLETSRDSGAREDRVELDDRVRRVAGWGFFRPVLAAIEGLGEDPALLVLFPVLGALAVQGSEEMFRMVLGGLPAVLRPIGGIVIGGLMAVWSGAYAALLADRVLRGRGSLRETLARTFGRLPALLALCLLVPLVLGGLLFVGCVVSKLGLLAAGAVPFWSPWRKVLVAAGGAFGLLVFWVQIRAMVAVLFTPLVVVHRRRGLREALREGWILAGRSPFGTLVFQVVVQGLGGLALHLVHELAATQGYGAPGELAVLVLGLWSGVVIGVHRYAYEVARALQDGRLEPVS